MTKHLPVGFKQSAVSYFLFLFISYPISHISTTLIITEVIYL